MKKYKEWDIIKEYKLIDNNINWYKIHFYRTQNSWYDEIRYDSDEIKKGKRIKKPHFHLKIQSKFKLNMDEAINEIKNIIDNHFPALEELLKK